MVLSARPRLLFFVVSKFFVCCFKNFGCSIFPFNCSLTNLTTDSHSINRETLFPRFVAFFYHRLLIVTYPIVVVYTLATDCIS